MVKVSDLRTQTGFTASQWRLRLMVLYNEAKRRHDGYSLTIYGDVSAMLDYLDGWEAPPSGFDLARELNDLAGRLRRE